jgi:signal peptidase I
VVKEKKKGGFRDTFDSIVVAFVIAMIIRAFFIQAYKIPSGSMLNTLLIGDHILVNKMAYKFSSPKEGDIIVFEYPLDPSKDFIKRVIGVEGDTIEIKDKKLYRNGKRVDEKYTRYESNYIVPANLSPRDNLPEFKVPKGYVFVMGDNRDSSFDGRYWGFVNKKLIRGKALIIYWSWNFKDGSGIRFNRILKLIH